ncbi:aconitate hydratase AcnA [Candidatus Palauibacter polyketidifaciens]|uniref:aconitate hydratase AcnA n=1 Tax=Candidatus Palauibacter polyketidifaciens TaxID=3056740 RepID=UPI00238BB37C|nr:aconitate hydratase AcnA [Candidatus Palauibacter polyketidifaciens]MDE2719508.1 aconitate hydratase AcnA [Candidatus Palauibacter polyketidifaciens]
MSNLPQLDSFGARASLDAHGGPVAIRDLRAVASATASDLSRLPFSIKIVLENLVRHEDGQSVTAEDIAAIAGWDAQATPGRELSFRPARVLLQDFTGVPAVVDLAAMRDAMAELGGDPASINPLMPCELVIDHSVQVDSFGSARSFLINAEREFERNHERYAFLRWGQTAFDNFKVVPPGTGIVHQVNLEYLARVVFDDATGGERAAYPDTVVGTDSHTTMVNGLGVLGWGVGGIEAEAAMLGQALSMLVPRVLGFRLRGRLPDGATATDLVLRVTEVLRSAGVVGKFVEFYGPGLAGLSLADRATLGNMSPEFGSTCAIFPIDAETLAYLRFTGRSGEQVALVEAYARAQSLFHDADTPPAEYSDHVELDLSTVEPAIAGPKLPQQRVPLSESKPRFLEALDGLKGPGAGGGGLTQMTGWSGDTGDGGVAVAEAPAGVAVRLTNEQGESHEFSLHDGSVVIAAITSCTNTSNPSVMVGAGLLARKAVESGLRQRPWVKTSLAPGSMVVTEYLNEAGLMPYFEQLGFHVVGYGCTTCIGNTGPLPAEISGAIRENDLVACSVLSGNRNFEGRISPDSRANYLASPPLVVAYALAGRMDIDLYSEPLGTNDRGEEIFLRDIWPSQDEINEAVRTAVKTEMFRAKYAEVYAGDERWNALEIPVGDRFAWDEASTYVRQPTFFAGMSKEAAAPADIEGARCLALLGDAVTTDHISPAGGIAPTSPAADYLRAHGVALRDFNSYGARRGNHEVMMRGTFANIRLRNLMVPGVEGGFTRHVPSGEQMTIFDAATRYREEGTPTIVIGGALYGSGSSRDWAAKGPFLQGVQAVIAVSYERIHRSNLIGMGILPLQFREGETAETLGLTGNETFRIEGIADGLRPKDPIPVIAVSDDGSEVRFEAIARLDTEVEVNYYRNGGILQTVLRQQLEA